MNTLFDLIEPKLETLLHNYDADFTNHKILFLTD